MILPQKILLRELEQLKLPVYSNYKVHFKDVIIGLTKRALLDESEDDKQHEYDNILQEHQDKLDTDWANKHKSLKRVDQLPFFDSAKVWAGTFIIKLIKAVNSRKLHRKKSFT